MDTVCSAMKDRNGPAAYVIAGKGHTLSSEEAETIGLGYTFSLFRPLSPSVSTFSFVKAPSNQQMIGDRERERGPGRKRRARIEVYMRCLGSRV